jgi:hypothetical protein
MLMLIVLGYHVYGPSNQTAYFVIVIKLTAICCEERHS